MAGKNSTWENINQSRRFQRPLSIGRRSCQAHTTPKRTISGTNQMSMRLPRDCSQSHTPRRIASIAHDSLQPRILGVAHGNRPRPHAPDGGRKPPPRWNEATDPLLLITQASKIKGVTVWHTACSKVSEAWRPRIMKRLNRSLMLALLITGTSAPALLAQPAGQAAGVPAGQVGAGGRGGGGGEGGGGRGGGWVILCGVGGCGGGGGGVGGSRVSGGDQRSI